MKLISSSPEASWQEHETAPALADSDLGPGNVVTTEFKGFGGCFNELGWRALAKLETKARTELLSSLFSPEGGCDFDYCRIPIGANDFSESWYSHNETPDDFGMAHFSAERDKAAILPYLEAAREAHGRDFHLFASAWSPPSWMKRPAVYNHGTLIWDPRHRKAYADYLARFVEAYAALGLRVDAVHVQNEPDSDQKFPSCVWTGAKLRDFIRDDLGPAFAAAQLDTEIWLGTIERGSYNDWILPVFADREAAEKVCGIGFQWAGRYAVQRTRQAHPDLPIIQTESECGDGSNSWDHAHHVFDLLQHYLSNGASAYVYWNMVLEPGGVSSWGWPQNSLFTVDPDARTATANPEFFVLKHFARYVRPGAKVLEATGRWAGNAMFFQDADGGEIVVVQNPLRAPATINIAFDGRLVGVELPARSVSTLTS